VTDLNVWCMSTLGYIQMHSNCMSIQETLGSSYISLSLNCTSTHVTFHF